MPNAVRVATPTGILGSGFPDESVEQLIEWKPDVLACDAGSTDPGPHYLGSGRTLFSDVAVRDDLGRMLEVVAALGIPLVIGSAGTSGRDDQVTQIVDIVADILANRGVTMDAAAIFSQQYPAQLREWSDRIVEFEGRTEAKSLSVDSVTVAVMGPEPIRAALDNGSQIVIAGRASDAALFAAVPIGLGMDTAASWHAGKVLECGAAAATRRVAPGGMVAEVSQHGFWVEPLSPNLQCTPASVATHSLYENPNPMRFVEPGGTIDISSATYEALSDRRVAVMGAQSIPASEYTGRIQPVVATIFA